jgi:hypothetical protein
MKILRTSTYANVMLLFKYKDGTIQKSVYRITSSQKIIHFLNIISDA